MHIIPFEKQPLLHINTIREKENIKQALPPGMNMPFHTSHTPNRYASKQKL